MTARKAPAKKAAPKKASTPRAPRAVPNPSDEGLRPLHDGVEETAPIAAFEHPVTGLLVLHDSLTRDAEGRAVPA